jgi:hypothetical protein
MSFRGQLAIGQGIALATTVVTGLTGILVLHVTSESANQVTQRYICKQLVDAHGGTIGVQTGSGTRFWFELPLKPSA